MLAIVVPRERPMRALVRSGVRLPVLLMLLALLLTALGALLTGAAMEHLLRRDAEIPAQRWAADLQARLPTAAAEWRAALPEAWQRAGILGFVLDGAGGSVRFDAAMEAPPLRSGAAIVPLRAGTDVVGLATVSIDQTERGSLYRGALLLGAAGLAGALLPVALAVALLGRRDSRRRREAAANLDDAVRAGDVGLPRDTCRPERGGAQIAPQGLEIARVEPATLLRKLIEPCGGALQSEVALEQAVGLDRPIRMDEQRPRRKRPHQGGQGSGAMGQRLRVLEAPPGDDHQRGRDRQPEGREDDDDGAEVGRGHRRRS